METQALVEVDPALAYKKIKEKTAQLVTLFPVYEVKVKDGREVFKVRLVGDGSRQKTIENTYAATPSREELLLLLQLIASFGWELVHLDEIRAFLNAPKKSKEEIYVKFRKDSKIYQVVNALYGLKGSPRDYQLTVRERLASMGCVPLLSSQCLYICTSGEEIIIIYVYVDDFLITGSNVEILNAVVEQTRINASTTTPIYDPIKVLGMELQRNHSSSTIQLTMKTKITTLATSIGITGDNPNIVLPLPAKGFIIKPDDLPCKDDQVPLTTEQKSEYLRVVGSLIWISGVRPDILFATMYLSWSTKNPLLHHKRMSEHLVQYLFNTQSMPMVVGGKFPSEGIEVEVYTDASLGTAPNGKSVVAHLVKVQHDSASIITKAKATTNVYLSSFESELDGYINATKSLQRMKNILEELKVKLQPTTRERRRRKKKRNAYVLHVKGKKCFLRFYMGRGFRARVCRRVFRP
jgi:hypothetical protein